MPVCLQIGHAGRKASSQVPWHGGMLIQPEDGGWRPLAPSALPHQPQEAAPQELTLEGIDNIRADFMATARHAQALGLEALELHAAHGYLLHEFLSPLSNQRNDAYGGSFDNRTRLIREVFAGVRQVFDGTLGIRLSGTDWVAGGWTVQESVQLSRVLRTAGAQYVHMSSGGISPQQKIALGPGYQVPLARAVPEGEPEKEALPDDEGEPEPRCDAEALREGVEHAEVEGECEGVAHWEALAPDAEGLARAVRDANGVPTIAVGMITEPAQAEAVLANGDADLVALARAFLYNPRWGWSAAAALQGQVQAQPQYWRCLPGQATGVFGPGARIGMR